MARTVKEAILHRRSYYRISNTSPLPESELKELINFAVLHVPSAFNSQSTRLVLLLGEHHTRLWEIVKSILQDMVPADAFEKTRMKVDTSFAAGHGTILFYEDLEVIEKLQKDFPTYRDKFPEWSGHTSAMHQFAIWTLLEDAGLGASLQHYNPLIDERVAEQWHINPMWRLIAQMPFGTPEEQPGQKTFEPLDKRILLFE
ncbi:MAG: nitroreductase family protein [Tannerellaceae bacterium]|nr:nitroreductase family protein [Tannerellaceae bacterium]MCD8262761.1 nitroreductase family protein [Tannerellaceae bacterium]